MSINAYQFKRDFLDKQPLSSIYRILTESLNYYFFSHLHNTEITHLEYPVIVDHLQDFIFYYSQQYEGDDISMAYAEYYKINSKSDAEVQKFIWNMLYSLSLYSCNSGEIQCLMSVIERNQKDVCIFFYQLRQIIADMNSIKISDVYLDILEIPTDNLHLYFQAMFDSKAILKMPLLIDLSKRPKLFGSDLAKVLIEDFLNAQKNKKFHEDKAATLSLKN